MEGPSTSAHDQCAANLLLGDPPFPWLYEPQVALGYNVFNTVYDTVGRTSEVDPTEHTSVPNALNFDTMTIDSSATDKHSALHSKTTRSALNTVAAPKLYRSCSPPLKIANA